MAKVYDALDDKLAEWIGRQPLFFVGTAPLSPDGHVNVSPKGLSGTFAILGPRRVAYLDLTGSGIETLAHLRENARIVIMFCAFEGPPRILRVHGRGAPVFPHESAFAELSSAFDLGRIEADGLSAGIRSIVDVEVERIADSCGYVVPLMRYESERPQMPAWIATQLKKSGPNALREYASQHNSESIDRLPGLAVPGAEGG